ncbi:MAG: penicillin-binding protein 1A [Desulfosarcina sp.]|nr:penicillin-binding protein 1A [Desulfosarcina sp.]MBC2742534.1 penicillin-binding protein 1A [Desulfosarcina sp.]MBC2765444.1 penicillin-binding protein 1A [Desulfosarcina sp.]
MSKEKSASQILKKRARRQPGATIGRLVKWSLLMAVILMIMGATAMVGVYFYLSDGLPKITSLTDYHPSIITTVYSDDNRKIAEFYKERRIVVPLSKIPIQLQQAFIAAEDARFYKHQGIDFFSIIRAFLKNLEAGAIVQGGSTITQQVTKSFLLTPERSYERKIKEAILAYRIDKTFTKEEILYLYLNQIYLGHGAYGVEAAAENYFGKSVSELNLSECAILAGLPQAPSRYSPFRFSERAKQRQIYVLNRMLAEGFINNTEVTEAIDVKMDIKPRRNWYIEEVPIYTEHIRRYVEKKYGEEALYTQGLKIYAAVNIEMQKAARQEIEKGLRELDHRQGYRGPEAHLAPEEIESFSNQLQSSLQETLLAEGTSTKGVIIDVNDNAGTATVRMGDARGVVSIEDIRWARKPNPNLAYYQAHVKKVSQVLKTGDVILVRVGKKQESTDLWELSLDQVPEAQSALLCIEAETGLVKVMVGGRDFMESQFNRAIQSRRQPGSAFKPIIYAAALDKGFTAATEIIDAPIVFEDEVNDFTWKPKNYGKKFYGPTLLREALSKSRNVVTIKILQDIGIDYCIDYARNLGIESELARNLSIALGSSGISLLELVNAYAVFANQGYLVEPAFITKIEDRFGNILEEMNPSGERVIDKSTAYIMTSLLESVVKEGTGKRVKVLNRPVAGKTGTTNDLQDAWFVGYTPRFISGVWVGYDNGRTLGKGETGSRTASPIWLGFMDKILKDKPVRVFQVPEGVVFAKIDVETGLLPIPESRKTLFECFKEGTVPTEYTKKPDTIVDAESFFKSDM